MRPHPLDHIPTLEAAERFELSSSEVEARSIDPLCYAASLLPNSGAGCGNRTHFVSLKRRVHIRICQSREPTCKILVGDAGIEPAWSRLRGECICSLCQSPTGESCSTENGAGCWNRTNASRLSTAGSTFELILLRSTPPFGCFLRSFSLHAWCAVRELNPHLLGVGQLFWSVELPAQNW